MAAHELLDQTRQTHQDIRLVRLNLFTLTEYFQSFNIEDPLPELHMHALQIKDVEKSAPRPLFYLEP